MYHSAVQQHKKYWRSQLSWLLAGLLVASVFLVSGITNASAADSSYTVQRGDNLTAIAARYGLTVQALAQANGIANVNNIYVGQVLKIPSATGSNSNNAPAVPTTGEQAYIVQRGDTLSAIATRFNVPLYELASYNKLSVMSYIYVGQTIRIPGSAAPASSTPATPTKAAPTATPVVVQPTKAPVSNAQVTNYTVQPGDNLAKIAAKYGTTVDAIQKANNIVNPNTIFAGQVLVIPGNGQPVSDNQSKPAAPASNPAPATSTATSVSSDGKWIDVNLSQQRLTAYEGSKAVFTSLVSTGVSNHPTVTGTFNIYVKYVSQAMSGGSGREYYYLPGVPYVMYFYQAYAIHGTYWHNNFGHPMSHGCVNLPTPAAKFMYSWASVGTPVKIHY